MCGEHQTWNSSMSVRRGSSPRVRGTQACLVIHEGIHGIIPACAGNTCSISVLRLLPRDHPRVCGEHSTHWPTWPLNWGSSPRVRGTQTMYRKTIATAGIIPACAGNTWSFSRPSAVAGDHPRVCGEHDFGNDPQRRQAGSSPRVRGTPHWLPLLSGWSGIIPACAGNTPREIWRKTIDGDHPRVCGEHVRSVRGARFRMGSSPRVRGTPCAADCLRWLLGIIPACAGNTSPRQCLGSFHRDHPRVCGEHFSTLRPIVSMSGSSPRVRGTPSRSYD